MSVHKRNGRWQVKWREGGRQRSRTFDRKGDADTFDREIKRRQQLGSALVAELTRAELTLGQFVVSGWRTHAATLSIATRKQYAWALELHLSELLDYPLTALDVPTLAAHQRYLLDNGRTANTVREAILRLSGLLQIAVEHGHIASNPARAVRKVSVPRRDEVRPLSPAELEALIAAASGRDRAILVLGGHFGLRPLEIRLVPWRNLSDSSLTVGRARTKRSAARTRVLAAPKASSAELKRWRLEAGRPEGDAPIVGAMTKSALVQWGWKRLQPLASKVIGREDVTVYTLRHTHASALHYAGFTVPAAARRLGHGPALHVTTYAHVIDALEGQPRHDGLDALIAAARVELASGPGSRSARSSL